MKYYPACKSVFMLETHDKYFDEQCRAILDATDYISSISTLFDTLKKIFRDKIQSLI